VRIDAGESSGEPKTLTSRRLPHQKETTEPLPITIPALKLDPKMENSLYGRGVTKLKMGDSTGGNSDIAAAKALRPTSPRSLRARWARNGLTHCNQGISFDHVIEGGTAEANPGAATVSVDFFAEFLGARNEVFDERHGFLQIVHPSAVYRNSFVVIKQFEPKVERFAGRNLTEFNKSNFVCPEARQRHSLQSVFVFRSNLELYESSTKSRFNRHF
jgi:hypothetical protein